MKKLILLSTFFISISVYALPNCPSETSVRWDNCFGTYTFPDGSEYVGEWMDDQFHGLGTYTYADGAEYVGEFKDGERHGQGTFTFADGDKYSGQYKDGKRHGQGTYTFAYGDQYVGEFKDGNWHGRGTYTFANGRRDDGYYMNNEYIPDICEAMGLVKGTESFGNCVNNLIEDL